MAQDEWAHVGDSPEELLTELKGILANDRHERFFQLLETTQASTDPLIDHHLARSR